MLAEIEKIIYNTSDKLYLKFKNDTVKVLKLKDLDLPKEQKKIVKENWQNVIIGDMSCLQFNPLVEIGSDTIYKLAKEVEPIVLLKIAEKNKVAQKRILKILSSLF